MRGLVADPADSVCASWPARASAGADALSLVIPFTPGGTLGAELMARARADGRTLLLGSTSSLALAPLTQEGLRYDPERAFVGVGMLARAPMVLLVSAALAVRSWSELLQLARTRDEPAETLLHPAPKQGVHLLMPRLGEAVEPAHVDSVTPWWRALGKDGAEPAEALSWPKALPFPLD